MADNVVLFPPAELPGRKNVFNGPARPQSAANPAFWNVQFARPFHDRLGLSLVGKQAILCGVIGLLAWCCPTQISRFVVSSLVGEAVQAVTSTWRVSHVGNECREVQPRLINRDTAATIERIGVAGSREAASLHRLPASIGSASGLGVIVFACLSVLSDLVDVKASATAMLAHCQVGAAHAYDLPALALAGPSNLNSKISWGSGNDSEASKDAAS